MTTLLSAEMTSKKKQNSFMRWAKKVGWKHLVAWVMIAYALFPILYIFSTSLTDMGGIENKTLFGQFYLGNYKDLLTSTTIPYRTWLWNTFFIASVTAIISVFVSACAAFAFSRLRFRGRRAGLATIVIAQMFPQFLGIVAIYLLLSTLGDAVPALGLNSLVGLIVVYLGGALGVNTFLMYGYFNTIPRELDEAAKIDGAGHARIFFTIILPLVGPILVVVGMLIYIATAGDFVIASVVLSDTQIQTAPVGLYGMISLFRNDNWGAFCAGAVLTALPVMILFLFTQKYIVTGLFAGSGK